MSDRPADKIRPNAAANLTLAEELRAVVAAIDAGELVSGSQRQRQRFEAAADACARQAAADLAELASRGLTP